MNGNEQRARGEGHTPRGANDPTDLRNPPARLIAFEGIDGSGKGTQARLLVDHFRQSGRKAALVSFPRYEETFFGRVVGSFLNGEFGSLDQVHPFFVSLLFAGDRFESRSLMSAVRAENEIVVIDRYVASNVAHQGAKLAGAERDALCRSIEHLEFDLYGIPPADRVVLLDLHVSLAQQLVAKKSTRSYTTRAADIQEADAAYLGRVRELYLELAAREPNWSVIRCEGPNGLRSVEEIAEEIWQLLSATGAQPAPRSTFAGGSPEEA